MNKNKIKFYLFFLLTLLLPLQLMARGESADNNVSAKHLVTLDFKKIAVRELLQFIAESMHYNIIISDNVTGNVSLHFKQVTWMQTLNSLLDMTGLVKKIDHNILYVGTPADFAVRQQNAAQVALLRSMKLALHHADAYQASTFLKTQSDILSPLAKVTCNLQDNSLWIKETVENLPLVTDFVHAIDKPEGQVLIAAKIVNIDDKKINELGLQFSTKIRAKGGDVSSSLSEGTPNVFNIAIISMTQHHLLNLELDALEKTGHSNLIADPKIITQNRKTAVIEAGEEIPYQEKTNSGATSVAFKKAALSLKVTPTALPDHRIILDLEISQNKISPLSVNGAPVIQTQELRTQVVVKSNESVILGGIYECSNAKVDSNLPGVSRLPLIGSLVNHEERQESRKELFILVTPYLMSS